MPEFNDITIEKCIATISQQSHEYEHGLTLIEQESANCKNAFEEIIQPLERLDNSLQLTWGVAKTLYLGNSSLMPTNSYLNIHQQAHRARTSKFRSAPIFQAIINEKNRLKKLSDEEQRLLDKFALEGKLNGLEVTGRDKEILNTALIQLIDERKIFREKVAIASKQYSFTIENPDFAKEFPETLLKSMAVNGGAVSQGPWKVTLQPHIYEPFMMYCPSRELRWNTWQAQMQRCSTYSHKELESGVHLEKIRALKQDQAKFLGYDSYVDMSMETKMAGSLENVNNVFNVLYENARPVQEQELELLQSFAKERGFDYKLEHWDMAYWQRKQKWTLYNFNEEQIKEYFPLPRVINSLFNLCSTLFNIQIIERSNVHTWHKDVKYYDVLDDTSNRPIAGFYLDPYARQDEKIRGHDDSGWHVTIRNKCTSTGTTPLSALIFNFQPPEEQKPSLLYFNEVGALFMKFGHALRHLLTTVNYSEVAGSSNVEWDAAEVCGHVMAHWLYDPKTIQSISGHYSTDEPLPEDIVRNFKNVRGHMAGHSICKELYLCNLDFELHSTKKYWLQIVKDSWSKYNLLPFDKYDFHPLTFTDVISEEWGAAYFCHLWSRMIAADVYSAFEEAKQGKQDIVVIGKRYKETFLAHGGGCHPSEVFRRFRGRDPSPNALLYNLGLSKKLIEG